MKNSRCAVVCGSGFLHCLMVLLLLGGLTGCHPRGGKPQGGGVTHTLTPEDSVLAQQFPVLEHLIAERDWLLQHSTPVKKAYVPDGTHMRGNFSNGKAAMVFDEVDGEPAYLYGHVPEAEAQLEFIIYAIPDATLEALVAGETYVVHWVETVVNTEPFDDDQYRYFLAYQIDKK